MIAASSFDDIIAITVFGIMVSLYFESLGAGDSKISGLTSNTEEDEGGHGHGDMSVGETIAKNILEVFSGVAAGMILGFMLSFFNYFSCMKDKYKQPFKLIIMIGFAFCFPILSYIT